jgi:hypothetical protein
VQNSGLTEINNKFPIISRSVAMSYQTKHYWRWLPLACALLANEVAAKGGTPPPPPVNTIPANLQAELNGGVKLLGGIAISGNSLAATCGYITTAGIAENAVCMYQRSGTTWAVQPKVLPLPSPALIGAAGLSASTMVIPVTITGDTSNFSHHVFERSASLVWNQQAVLTANPGVSFTETSAISGNTLAIKGFSPTLPATSGGVFIYQRAVTATGSVWALQAVLNPSETISNITSIDIDVDTAVLTTNSPAAAYVFKRTTTTTGSVWSQQAKLVPSDLALPSSLGFGETSSISGDTIVIGAPYAQGVNPRLTGGIAQNAGAVYVFRRNAATWTQSARIERNPGAARAGDRFGSSVAASGVAVAVQADGGFEGPGSAWVYQQAANGSWPLVSSVNPAGTWITLRLPNGISRGNIIDIDNVTKTYVSLGVHGTSADPATLLNSANSKAFVFTKP